MKIFLTGANGFVGLHTIGALTARGHHVLALVRSDKGAQKIESHHPSSKDIIIVRGSTQDAHILTQHAAEADGVIHLAYNHDFAGTDRATADKEDNDALEALVKGLTSSGSGGSGGGKPLVCAGGVVGLREGGAPGTAELQPLTEDEEIEGTDNERANTGKSLVGRSDVKGIIVRFPVSVHGKGDMAFVSGIKHTIAQHHKAAWIGEGANRWPATHVKDVAQALVLAAEKGKSGFYHAIAEEGIPFKDIAKACGDKAGVSESESLDPQEAGKFYTWLTGFAGSDAPASANKTKAELGWEPKEIGLLQDIKENY